MFIIDKNQYRNLQEQVLKNKQDIAAHYNVDRVLADFGIKIIGQLTPEQFAEEFLENQTPPPTGDEDYGASYAVGTTDPYDFYIWTRADIDANGTHSSPYWLNIGKLAIEGIQGPPGEQGPKGDTGASTRWYSVSSTPTSVEPAGTMALNRNTGDVYESNGTKWNYRMNIKGPQGEEGPRGYTGERGAQGPTGPQGIQGARGLGLVILATDLASESDLPSPTSVRRDGAYLVGTPKHLYAITGTTDLQWEDLGEYNVTPSLPEGKLYQHNCSIRFNLWGGTTISFNPIYNTNPERITKDNYQNYPGVVWNTNELHYGDGAWQIINKFNYYPDWGGDPAWVLEGVQFYNDTAYGTVGTFSLAEYGDPIANIYDAVKQV